MLRKRAVVAESVAWLSRAEHNENRNIKTLQRGSSVDLRHLLARAHGRARPLNPTPYAKTCYIESGHQVGSATPPFRFYLLYRL
jgi:hypothetical protein